MQQYIITGFKNINDNSLWIRQETGTNSGGYVKQNSNLTLVKRLNDFLCDGDFVIYSIKKPNTAAFRNVLYDEFKLEDRLGGRLNGWRITKIKIELSDAILFYGEDVWQRIRLNNAEKYIAPVKTATKSVSKRVTKTKENSTILFSDIQERIEANVQPVRLTRTLKKRKESVEEFLKKFLTKWNVSGNEESKDTVYVESGGVQTESGRRRSLGDIFMILKYYYPDVTLKEVIELLYVKFPHNITGYRSSTCSEILKRVFYIGEQSGIYNEGHTDEYSNTWNYYITKLRE